MKNIFYLFLMLLCIHPVYGSDSTCRKDIEESFDSKELGECVYSSIKEDYSSDICYYSNLLQRLSTYRLKNKDLIKINAENILSENPKKLFELYQIVGICKLSNPEPHDVIFEMEHLLDVYNNGLFPNTFYGATLSTVEQWTNVNINSANSEEIRNFYIEMKNRVKNRKIIDSYEAWIK